MFFDAYQEIISLNSDSIDELPKAVKSELIDALADGLGRRDELWFTAVSELLAGSGGYEYSWLLSRGARHPFLIIDILNDMVLSEKIKPDDLSKIILSALVSESTQATFDLQHHLLDFFVRLGLPLYEADIGLMVDIIKNAPCSVHKSKESMIFQKSDGIDHVFPIPSSFEKRSEILSLTTLNGRLKNRALMLHRLLGAKSPSFQADYDAASFSKVNMQTPYLAGEALEFIKADSGSILLDPQDFLAQWTEIVVDYEGYSYSLAEVLRMVLLDPQSAFPDPLHRKLLGGFYRQCLRISQGAIIGLKAGVFHVEHGSLACPSLVYMGRRSILGKGCIVDGVGGVVLGEEAFLGGGFIPILIHTHKHAGGAGVNERKSILPAIFLAENSARLPMHSSGIFETYDYILEKSPFKGIRGIKIDGIQ
jgi:hypothetical protein